METTEKNRFSILLEQLINTGEVKNASLAAALRYDASYISKWITGRMIPAEKTKRKVLRGISQEIVRQSTQSGLENLCADYQISDCEELKTVIYDHLDAEYKGYTVDDIREKVKESLEEYMQPVDIIALPERPFFHFKTNRIGLTRDIEAGKFNVIPN